MTTKADDLLARLTVPDQETPDSRMSILLEGEPGTGKTHNALRQAGKTLVVYADNNRATLTTAKLDPALDITEIRIDKWKDFDPLIVNLIKNREFEFDNIVVDSYDALMQLLVDDCRGLKVKLGFDEWANVLNSARRVTFELTQACRPREDKRDYNILCTMHLQAQTDADNRIIKYEPALQGSFRSKVEAYFDLVLLSDSETLFDPDTKERTKTTFIRTVAPTNYHTCKAPLHWPSRVNSLEEIHKIIAEEASTTS